MNAEQKFNSLPIGSEIVFAGMPDSHRVVELNVHAPFSRGVMGRDYRVRMIYEIERIEGIAQDWTPEQILEREA